MDLISYALSKKLNWDNIKNKPFYDDTSITTITETLWCGGYKIDQDTWLQISDTFWNALLKKKVTPSCKYGTFVYGSEYENEITYEASYNGQHFVLHVSKSHPKGYVDCGDSDNTQREYLELTCEITTGEVKKIDSKYLPEIPKPTMIVNITQNDDGTYSADKTYDEILEFHNNGGIVEVLNQDVLFHLFRIGSFYVTFFNILNNEKTILAVMFGIISNNEVMREELGYTTLPPTNDGDENKFLKGDGTWAEIPTVTDEHINNLINEALGVIENGTY